MKQTDLEFITSYILNNLNKGTEQLPLTWKMTDEVFNGLTTEGQQNLQNFYDEEWSVMSADDAAEFVKDLDMDKEDEEETLDFLFDAKSNNLNVIIGYYLGFYDMRVSDYLDLLARFIDYDNSQTKENA